MKNRILIASSILVLGLATTAFARGPGGCDPGERFQDRRDQFFEEVLQVTDTQQRAINDIRQKYRDEKRAQFKNRDKGAWMNLDPADANYLSEVERLAEEKAAKMKEGMIQRAKMHAEIYALLTPEQQVKFKEAKGKWGNKRSKE